MSKVLVFTNNVLPATQTFIRAQATNLRRYTTRHIGLAPYSPSLPVGQDAILLTQNRSSVSRLRKELYKWVGTAPRFHAEARAADAGILHVHFAEDATLATSLQRAIRLPLVVSLHGGLETQPDRMLRKGFRGWEYLLHRRAVWEQATMFVCASKFIRDKAVQSGYPAHKCHVLHIGVDLDFFVPSDVPRDREVVLFVGRFVEKKGIEYLLRAMAQVQATRPQAKLVLIGDGPLREEMRQLQEELGVRCEFLGLQAAPAVKQWMQRCRVLCVPSVEGKDGLCESLPMVLVEAQAMGTPVVSTYHGGISELITDGVSGRLVPERDHAGLATSLLTYLEDDAAWSQAAQAGIARVREGFDLRTQNAGLEALYDRARELGAGAR